MALYKSLYIQDFAVHDTVTEAESEDPLSGVTVIEHGTQTGTSTDDEANCSLQVSGPDVHLVFSFAGNKTIIDPVNGLF